MSRPRSSGSKPITLLACFALASVCACASQPRSAAAARTAPELTADQLLARVRERYSRASSYQDSGTMSSVVDAAGMGASRTSTTFRTAFERQSGRFYFDYNEARGRILPPERVVIWQAQPGSAQIWRTAEPGQVEEEELSGALSAMQGVSNGLTAIAPRLLLPPPLSVEPGPFQVAYHLEGVERIGETPAFRLVWEGQQRSIRMWIRQSDFALIRFIDHQVIAATEPDQQEHSKESLAAQIQRFQTERQNTLVSDTTIDFRPVFGAALDASEFQFSPPPGG
jgi:outer membrane lipoprotein-sorting protein